MTRNEWLAERRNSVQATDIVTLCGLGYAGQSAETVYAEKLGIGVDREPDMRMRLGTVLEPFVAELFTEATGIHLCRHEHAIVRSCVDPWIGATLDYSAADFSAAGPECKVVFGVPNDEWGNIGTDVVPQRVVVQTQWQMLTTGHQQSYVACLFAPYSFRWYLVRRDDALCNALRSIAADFWLRVLERSGVSGWDHPLAAKVAAMAVRVEPGRVVELNETDLARAEELEAFEAGRRVADEAIERLKRQLVEAMNGAEFGRLPDGSRLKRSITQNRLTRSGRPKNAITKPNTKELTSGNQTGSESERAADADDRHA